MNDVVATEQETAALVNLFRDRVGAIRDQVRRVIVGQDEVVDYLLLTLLVGGHCLITGMPGTAKTLLVKTLASALGLSFKRIQFTPDLMPTDVTGTDIIEEDITTGHRRWTFVPGPLFANVLLADEVNRTPPKTQAALLEAMQERRVTLDGETHRLPDRFMVLATQNPIENQGVYPLPEAQLDRFLFKLLVPYPAEEEEARIVATYGKRSGPQRPADLGVTAVTTAEGIAAATAAVGEVTVAEDITRYVVRLIRATREHAELTVGASPRAAVLLAGAARARAALEGRAYVIPDDVKALAVPVLRHRLTLSPAAEIEGRDMETLVAELVEATEAPR
ncbi:MAG: magnesium chelatase [Erythrobacter sp.]|nr:magnesium chelatase [Erythrobacter sp.]